MNEIIKAQAEFIAERLNDRKAIKFHYYAIKKVGFNKCYELSSLALQVFREGIVKTTAARYFNGCIKKEIQKKHNKDK